ncbi:hypothetical protein [Promicromonospora panici]|nr:hypothetical protein [Promicromonospora panici]
MRFVHQPAATVTGPLQPKGWSGRWDVTETVRKVYSIGVLAAGG